MSIIQKKEDTDYYAYLERKNEHFESLCLRCGFCCGAGNDPCENLAKDDRGVYYCKAYENRLGPQRTISGKHFTCVSIREHIKDKALHPRCGYNVLLT